MVDEPVSRRYGLRGRTKLGLFSRSTDSSVILFSFQENFLVLCIRFVAGQPLSLLCPAKFPLEIWTLFKEHRFLGNSFFPFRKISSSSAFASLPGNRLRSFALPNFPWKFGLIFWSTDSSEILFSLQENFLVLCVRFVAGQTLSLLCPAKFPFGNLDSFFGAQTPQKFFFPFRKISSSSAFASLPGKRFRSFALPNFPLEIWTQLHYTKSGLNVQGLGTKKVHSLSNGLFFLIFRWPSPRFAAGARPYGGTGRPVP